MILISEANQHCFPQVKAYAYDVVIFQAFVNFRDVDGRESIVAEAPTLWVLGDSSIYLWDHDFKEVF